MGCMSARDEPERQAWEFKVTHAKFRHTPSLDTRQVYTKRPESALNFLTGSTFQAASKAFYNYITDNSFQHLKPSLAESSLYCDYCDTKFDYHLLSLMVERVQKDWLLPLFAGVSKLGVCLKCLMPAASRDMRHCPVLPNSAQANNTFRHPTSFPFLPSFNIWPSQPPVPSSFLIHQDRSPCVSTANVVMILCQPPARLLQPATG